MPKICSNCGNELSENAKFCSKCGTKYESDSGTFCQKCGHKINKDAKFCTYCGNPIKQNIPQKEPNKNIPDYIKKSVNTFTSSIDNMAGENGDVEINLKKLFSKTFSPHTLEEREELFISGTSKTTPSEENMIAEWPTPWLYAQIFIMLCAVFAGLYFMILEFNNTNAIPGAMFIGALIVPFSLVVFFWETNIPKNISIFEVVSIFFLGGVLSLISTLFLYEIVGDVSVQNYQSAILVGIAEEVGKIIVVGHYIKKNNYKYILNGLLLGACVGAGFAVFETAGYAFSSFILSGSLNTMMYTLLIRAVLALGGHTVWTAIAGAGLVSVKGEKQLTVDDWTNINFLKFLIFVIALHSIWDMPISFGSKYFLVQWILTAIALLTIFTLLNSGLKQVTYTVQKANEKHHSTVQNSNDDSSSFTENEEPFNQYKTNKTTGHKIIPLFIVTGILIVSIANLANQSKGGTTKGSATTDTSSTEQYVTKDDFEEKFRNYVDSIQLSSGIKEGKRLERYIMSNDKYAISIVYDLKTNYVQKCSIQADPRALVTNISSDGTVEISSEEELWQCALIESLLNCGSDQALSLMYEANPPGKMNNTMEYNEYTFETNRSYNPPIPTVTLTVHNTKLERK